METIIDEDYEDDLGLLENTPALTEYLLQSLKHGF